MVNCSPPPEPIHQKVEPVSRGIKSCPFIVAIDTREQSPWAFQAISVDQHQQLIQTEKETLQTGDYSIVGCEEDIVIERKSADDFLGSIGGGHARFRREHERMVSIVGIGGFACVIVEGCFAAICDELDDSQGTRRIGSSAVIGITASWPAKYHVPWFFAGDRRRAELLGFRVLWKWWHYGK